MNNIEELLQEPWITLLQFLPHQKPFQLKRGCKYRKLLAKKGIEYSSSDLIWVHLTNLVFGIKMGNTSMMVGCFCRDKTRMPSVTDKDLYFSIETFQQAIDMIHNPNFEQLKAFL